MDLVLFDGVCKFCNRTILFLIRLDKKGIIRFAPLQSKIGQDLLMKYNLPTNNFKTIIFLSNGKIYTKSGAILKVFSKLGGVWYLISVVCSLVPKSLRDGAYSVFSKYRHFFQKRDSLCEIPNQDVRSRFIE